MAEVRIMREGTLRWVQGSGVGGSWATATAPQSGLFGFVTQFSMSSGRSVQTVSDRGTPSHHKITDLTPIEVQVTYQWTGYNPEPSAASGASVPFVHMEFRANEPENGNSGRYFQFYGAIRTDRQFSEAADGNTLQETYRCLGMMGPTSSGYLG